MHISQYKSDSTPLKNSMEKIYEETKKKQSQLPNIYQADAQLRQVLRRSVDNERFIY